jgi:hypothetical protein
MCGVCVCINCAHVNMCICLCVRACVRVRVRVRAYACMRVCVHACVGMCVYRCLISTSTGGRGVFARLCRYLQAPHQHVCMCARMRLFVKESVYVCAG